MPFATVSLLELGAKGNDNDDDTVAMRAAFQKSANGVCLDGGQRTYRVNGTLRADGGLCLVNTSLRQMIEAVDTRPYIKSTGRPPPVMTATEPTRFYPEDPVLDDAQHRALELRNNLRTILVTADGRASVFLRGVKVSRGDHETLGNGGNAAGIYVAGAVAVYMDDVEVYGRGRGHGIFVTASRDIRLSRLNIHDLLWSSDFGDRSFTLDQMRDAYNWNNVPLYAYDPKVRKFGVARSQEQTNGLVISNSENVSVEDSRISEILYNAHGTYIPWQADGITVGDTKNVRIVRTTIDNVWEGIDFTGQKGVDSFHLGDLTISNSFTYGLKLVWATRSGVVDGVNIRFSGMNGIVVAGSASDIDINNATVLETGTLNLRNGTRLSPYFLDGVFRQNIAGIDVSRNSADPSSNPKRIRVRNATVRNVDHPQRMRFGVSSSVTEADNVTIENLRASGFKWSATGSAPIAQELERKR